mmetsp:Transcript_27795/g.77732  ORF Transcript_27795/g.77732 Transcript_27795/m.77732 type:complete len:96 (+) Transcript_27795:356-643(+)
MNAGCVALLRALMNPAPEQRISATDALSAPWINKKSSRLIPSARAARRLPGRSKDHVLKEKTRNKGKEKEKEKEKEFGMPSATKLYSFADEEGAL